MRRTPSLFWAQLISGLVAVGAAAGCKGTPIIKGVGHLTLAEELDGGTETSFDLGEACNGFTTTTTLYLVAAGAGVDGVSIAVSVGSTFFTVTQPSLTSVEPGTPQPFTVTFNPPLGSNPAPESATLVITSINSDDSPLSVSLTATVSNAPSNAEFAAKCQNSTSDSGVEGTCTFLIFSPPFHGVPLNSTGSQVVNVTNNGCPPLDLSAMLEDGGDPGYSFSGLTSPIALHQVVPVTVTFSPSNLSGTSQVLTFTSGYLDAGLPYPITLSGAGIAPVLVFYPISWGFPGAVPGQENCEQFTVTNNGSEAVTLSPPEIGKVPAGENGVFTIDAGWPANTQLAPGATETCVVCVDFSDAGVVYTALLEIGYDQGGSSTTSTCPLSASSSTSICTSVPEVNLPDDNMFCGFESGSFQIFPCSDGGSCLDITNISWADGGNFDDLGTITSIDSPNTGPWELCPGGADSSLTVNFTIHDNGLVRFVTDAIEIDSNATAQAKYDLNIVPITHAVPRENGAPVLIPTDAGPPPVQGYVAGYPILFEIEGNDDAGVNFVYQYYYTNVGGSTDGGLCINCGIPSWFDAGSDQAPYFIESAPYYDAIWFTPNDKGTFTICPIMLEVDAGFGNCGLDAGYPGKSNPLCSAPFNVVF